MEQGTTDPTSLLQRTRERVEELADDGAFVVACAETGVRPAPVSRVRFPSFEAAERARDAAVAYRERLREHDPGAPEYELAVCEEPAAALEAVSVRETTAGCRANGLPRTRRTVTLAGDGRDEWLRVENAPVIDLVGPDALLDDEVVERQLRTMEREP